MVLGLPVVLGASRLAGDRRDASSARNQIQADKASRIRTFPHRANCYPRSRFLVDFRFKISACGSSYNICCRERRGPSFPHLLATLPDVELINRSMEGLIMEEPTTSQACPDVSQAERVGDRDYQAISANCAEQAGVRKRSDCKLNLTSIVAANPQMPCSLTHQAPHGSLTITPVKLSSLLRPTISGIGCF